MDAVRKVIIIVTLDGFTTPIILNVIPPYRVTGETQVGYRALASMYAHLAAEIGPAYIDVEAFLSASPEADDSGCRGRQDLILLDSDDETLAQHPRLPPAASSRSMCMLITSSTSPAPPWCAFGRR